MCFIHSSTKSRWNGVGFIGLVLLFFYPQIICRIAIWIGNNLCMFKFWLVWIIHLHWKRVLKKINVMRRLEYLNKKMVDQQMHSILNNFQCLRFYYQLVPSDPFQTEPIKHQLFCNHTRRCNHPSIQKMCCYGIKQAVKPYKWVDHVWFLSKIARHQNKFFTVKRFFELVTPFCCCKENSHQIFAMSLSVVKVILAYLAKWP